LKIILITDAEFMAAAKLQKLTSKVFIITQWVVKRRHKCLLSMAMGSYDIFA